MKLPYLALCSFILFTSSAVASQKEPTAFSYNNGETTIDGLMPNSEDVTERFTKSSPDSMQKMESVFNKFKPTPIFDESGLAKASKETDRLGYVNKYCGIVMATTLVKDRSSYKPPVVQLVMMTDHFSPVKVTLPFRSSSNMKMDKQTLNYYAEKYSGKFICTDKVIVFNIIEGGISYILPYNHDLNQTPLKSNHTDINFIQIF